MTMGNLEMNIEEILKHYKMRWKIETLFGVLKTRGFNLESTQIADPTRVERLLGLWTIVAVWVRKMNSQRSTQSARTERVELCEPMWNLKDLDGVPRLSQGPLGFRTLIKDIFTKPNG
ncbi:MAG: transposase [Deinococcaceae bacterium]